MSWDGADPFPIPKRRVGDHTIGLAVVWVTTVGGTGYSRFGWTLATGLGRSWVA
jgi:hypothetical protein